MSLTTQNIINLYQVASLHAGLSAQSSMGQFLQFEAAASEAAQDQSNALKARRVSKTMVHHLNTIADLAPMIGAGELEDICERALQVRGETKDVSALMAQAVLFSQALDRTRIAASVVFDLCEAMGIAPNGKPLPKEDQENQEDTDEALDTTPSLVAEEDGDLVFQSLD